jgi:single-stranded-DNA-specific exonuclease
VVERHQRPAVLISIDADGGARGSGRSIPGFDLLAALQACDEHLTRYGGHRAAAGLELDVASIDGFRRAFAAHCEEALADQPPVRLEPVDAVVGADSLGHEVAEQLRRLGPFGNGNPGVRLLVPAAKLTDVRPMGEGDRHARFAIAGGSRRALGVAFGVNGSLEAVASSGPIDLSVELELNEWNGAIEPRAVLGSLYPAPKEEPPPEPGPAIDDPEFWRRFDVETAFELDGWPGAVPPTGRLRERLDRPTGSAPATIAALASSGAAVLVLCADALRRRELVERAVRPARFGGGELALISSRLPDAEIAAAEARVIGAGAGVALADWGALSRDPGLARRFEHVVVVDPPPFAQLDRLIERGEGWLHRLDDRTAAEFGLRVLADEWPSRSSLAGLYRELVAFGGGAIATDRCRELMCGSGRAHPHSPEVAARAARVLGELELLRWDGSGSTRTLMVVSSSGTDLERSRAYRFYRDRYEEGQRYLSERRQK